MSEMNKQEKIGRVMFGKDYDKVMLYKEIIGDELAKSLNSDQYTEVMTAIAIAYEAGQKSVKA
jgi:hypothetical protein